MAKLNVNGKVRDYQADSGTPLLWVLRIRMADSLKASDKITTIEGLSPDGTHPVQKAWLALDVPQCGFCQSGMIMAASALLKAKSNPTDADIDAATGKRIRDLPLKNHSLKKT